MKKALGTIITGLLLAAIAHPQTEPRLVVAWDAIQDSRLTGYRLKWGTSATTLTSVINIAANNTEVTVTGLDGSTTYSIVVMGLENLTGGGSREGEASAPIQANFGWLQPASPTGLSCSQTTSATNPGKKDITCSWGAVTLSRLGSKPLTGIKYTLYRVSNGQLSTPVYTGTARTFTELGITKNKTVYYAVTAQSTTGIESLGSPAYRLQTKSGQDSQPFYARR